MLEGKEMLEIKPKEEPSSEMEKTFAIMARSFMEHLKELGFERGNLVVSFDQGFSCQGERNGVKVDIYGKWDEAYGNDV